MQAFTILILEDEPYIASELAENAAENGYHVVVAHTAQQALDMVKN
jgi:DNA-binding response OmpR family regulator